MDAELIQVKKILRELIRAAIQSSYAEKTCSLNRARNMLNEILEPERVDAAELLKEVGKGCTLKTPKDGPM